jgi:ribonuclease PH
VRDSQQQNIRENIQYFHARSLSLSVIPLQPQCKALRKRNKGDLVLLVIWLLITKLGTALIFLCWIPDFTLWITLKILSPANGTQHATKNCAHLPIMQSMHLLASIYMII